MTENKHANKVKHKLVIILHIEKFQNLKTSSLKYYS